jgi:Sigma-70, region 4
MQAAIDLLAGLSQDQSEAVALRVIAGLETPVVASMLGKTEGAVRVALHRGLRALAADPAVQSLAARPGQPSPGQPSPGQPSPGQPASTAGRGAGTSGPRTDLPQEGGS